MDVEVLTDQFEHNVERMLREDEDELNEAVFTGASAYVTTAARYSPPAIGAKELDERWYDNGVAYDRSGARASYGRRRIYDLLQLARHPDTGHYRKLYGTLLRQGYYYAVSIRRPGRPVRFIPCRTRGEALDYSRETYRGLTRAVWGLAFGQLRGKMPPAFRKLIRKRPALADMTNLSTAVHDRKAHEITLTNAVKTEGRGYVAIADARASFQAMRTMNDRLNKYFKKHDNKEL